MFIVKKIRFKIKHLFDSLPNERIKNNFLQTIPFIVGAVISGLIAVLYSKLFAWTELGARSFLHKHTYYFIPVSFVCFVVSWWVVKKYAPFSNGSGIPQIMAILKENNKKLNEKAHLLLSVRIIIVKIVSSLLLVFGGGVIGREGPTIQVASSVYRKIYEWLPSWWPRISRRNMIITGAAAGLSAAFNTPLGGIVFAVEELAKTHLNFFKTVLFTSIIIAGLTSQAIMGPYLYLGFPNIYQPSFYVYFLVILVALICGLAGSGLSILILKIGRWKGKFKFNYQHILFLLACSLIIVLPTIFIDENMMGSGKDLMVQKLFSSDKYTTWYLALMRSAGPLFSFTTGGAGGIFAPALSAGAAIGSFFAGVFSESSTNANVLILAGMVGFLTGITRTPFTSAILVLEMTDRHNLIFHLMLAGIVSNMFSRLIDRHSLYDHLSDSCIEKIEEITIPEKKRIKLLSVFSRFNWKKQKPPKPDITP